MDSRKTSIKFLFSLLVFTFFVALRCCMCYWFNSVELHFAVDMIEGYETKTELQVMVLSI